MIGRDFSYEQDIKTVNMSNHEKKNAITEINIAFADHYRSNYHRFASMYDGRATVLGVTLTYSNMLPDSLNSEIFSCVDRLGGSW